MERRQMLKCLFAGGVSLALSVPVFAQQGRVQQRAPRPQGAPPRVANVPSKEGPQPAQVVVANPQELEKVLREWEQKTSRINLLRGDHERYEYDQVFGIEKRAVGKFYHEAPDKGRIDILPPDNPPAINKIKKTPSGEPYTIESEEPQRWICDGKMVLQIDLKQKTYGKADIPPQHQGENIMDGPLPFLFGMKADKIKNRYKLTLGDQHGKPHILDGRPQYHIVAFPLKQEDARNWQRAEVLLDAEFCLPRGIRLISPGGDKETVYVFPLHKIEGHMKFWIDNPFRMNLFGYKLTESHTAEPPKQQSGPGLGRAVQPASGTRPQ